MVRHFHAGHGPGRYVLVGGGEPEYLACDRCGSIEEVDRSELDSLREDVERRFGYAVGFTTSRWWVSARAARTEREVRGQ